MARKWPSRAIIRLAVPADSDTARSPAICGTVEPIDAHSCRLEIGAGSPQSLVFLLAAIDGDFRIEDGDEPAVHLRRIMLRLQSALG
ncbi:hypothetical protein [Nocardia sp. CA-119907]|uniref:hypothetical protein n=1 Tax=Nocardia sp. CA-119907 TaxID=3239973 RepID=UPI003D97555B